MTFTTVDQGSEHQRIDNYLFKLLKGVPKSRVYRLLREGQVRVNGRRAAPDYRLQLDDSLRIPPIRLPARVGQSKPRISPAQSLKGKILFQDDYLIVLDKPAGMAVHGGSGISLGVVEQLRAEYPEYQFLELVHRLDRETSGLLLLAKKRSALLHLHCQLRDSGMDKRYLVLVAGKWRNARQSVKLPLQKYLTAAGERRVSVQGEGQAAHTVFNLVESLPGYALLEAELKTGRTHQIRVHLSHLGFPIAGDDKYGDFGLNKTLAKEGLKRMFLHAWKVTFIHPASAESVTFEAPLPQELEQFLQQLRPDGAGLKLK